MRILVTGGLGFIGSHIVDSLVNSGHRVTVIDNLVNGKRENINHESDYKILDIRDPLAAQNCKGQDVVIHMAALGSVPRSFKNPQETYDVNVMGFRNILSGCEKYGVKKLVYASSSSVYGSDHSIPKTEDRIGSQLSPYSASKYINEVMCEPSPVNCVGLRFFNIYGPRQREDSEYSAVIPKWIKLVKSNNPIEIHGAETYRDFTYVSDAVRAVVMAIHSDFPGNEVFNVGTGKITTLAALAAHIRNALKVAKEDFKCTFGEKPSIIRSMANIDKAAKMLGYTPQVDIEHGVRNYIESLMV